MPAAFVTPSSTSHPAVAVFPSPPPNARNASRAIAPSGPTPVPCRQLTECSSL